ncbi:MAG: helix-turn-helix transcriptional regulator [Nitrobacter sp.]|uniref:helix-turn-helix domain-containing protein n=1 Tax=Nitrobacter sp. TaxID=29420 RepID=UPI0026083F28|nr:helix-turn-helix transcriptional regulator [Nitrobacter sp.]MCV0384867.1 helix-turn-helix transcriptional regulator [Nitrobacter sp.]
MADSVHPLRRFRLSHDPVMPREDLAALIGVSIPTVHRWESGARKVDVDLLSHVAAVTGIPARDLRPDLARLFAEAGQ